MSLFAHMHSLPLNTPCHATAAVAAQAAGPNITPYPTLPGPGIVPYNANNGGLYTVNNGAGTLAAPGAPDYDPGEEVWGWNISDADVDACMQAKNDLEQHLIGIARMWSMCGYVSALTKAQAQQLIKT
jgi:hypothetical protein